MFWKNPSTSAGFEPTYLGSRGEHVTPRPTTTIKPTKFNVGRCVHLGPDKSSMNLKTAKWLVKNKSNNIYLENNVKFTKEKIWNEEELKVKTRRESVAVSSMITVWTESATWHIQMRYPRLDMGTRTTSTVIHPTGLLSSRGNPTISTQFFNIL